LISYTCRVLEHGTSGGPVAPAPVHCRSSRIGTTALPLRVGGLTGGSTERPNSGAAREQPYPPGGSTGSAESGSERKIWLNGSWR
jgi:hypothetical protein